MGAMYDTYYSTTWNVCCFTVRYVCIIAVTYLAYLTYEEQL